MKGPEAALDTQKLQLQTSSPHKATLSEFALAASFVSDEGAKIRYIDRLMGATSLRALVFVGCCGCCDSDGAIDNNCRCRKRLSTAKFALATAKNGEATCGTA